MTSTSAALVMVLGNQIGAAAPAGIAASVTGVALAGAAAGGGKAGVAAATGVLGFLATMKLAVVVASFAVTAAGLGIAWSNARAASAAQVEIARVGRDQHRLQARLHELQEKFAQAEQRAQAADADAGLLLKTIQETAPRIGFPGGDAVGVAFVIDTSGSMRNPNKGQLWSGVFDAIQSMLAEHPRATFVTLYDGDGRPMFSRRGWLPLNGETMAAIEQLLGTYPQDSVSNPVPGVYNAMREAPAPTRSGPRLHVCVIGDEFNSAEKEEVALRRLHEINAPDATGNRRATISAVQLPTTIRAAQGGMGNTGLRFQALMAEAARQHAGSFKLLGDDSLR